MSRIGKKPIAIPSGVKVALSGKTVNVTGSGGNLSWTHADGVSVALESDQVVVTRASDSGRHRALHGTTRALIQNMVTGVSVGFKHKLEIYGTGYGCQLQGQNLSLTCGYSHPVVLKVPPGVKVDIEVPAARGDTTPAKLSVSGADKQAVGGFARSIKDARPPEPYKGKGILFEGEQIQRKAGKAFAGAGG
jgi:large subunit ribosomal protein L6